MDCFDIFYEQVDNKNYDMVVKIKTNKDIDNNFVYYIAPNPPDYRTSFSGSALPFFNKEQAFYNTSNKGKAYFSKCNKSTTIFLKYPNSYYTDLGNILVVPHVDLVYSIDGKEHLFTYKLSDNPIPYRSLTHPHTRTNPMFYQPKTNFTEVMSQSKLFRRTGFPTTNTSLNNFW